MHASTVAQGCATDTLDMHAVDNRRNTPRLTVV